MGGFVVVKSGGVARAVCLDEIWFVAACENYTNVLLADGRHLLVRRTMKEWIAVLHTSQFVRVHRGLIVNLGRIGRTEQGPQRTTLVRCNDRASRPLEIKRRYWPALHAKLNAWRLAACSERRARRAEKSIAVLPFVNLSTDAANEIFCDGVSEELLNVLAKVPDLRVAARTSSFYFKGRNLPVVEIARELNVDFVVEGSVRRIGPRVRITAQLIDAGDGFHLWSDNFDHESSNVLAVQDELAAQVAQNLLLSFGRKSRAQKPVDPTVHRFTIEGRHFWNLRTYEGFARAEKAFTQALALDSGFAPAHAGLADLHVVRAMYRLADGEPSASDDLTQARAEAQSALRLDSSLAEPHATLGFTSFHEGKFDDAMRDFPPASVLNHNYAMGYQFYAWTLCGLGRLDSALEAYAKAIALDPLSFINLDRFAAMLVLARRLSEALEMNERAAALRPDVFVGNISQRAPILLALGRTDDAIAMARTVRQTSPNSPYRRTSDADAIFVLQQAGLTAEASDYATERLGRLREGNYLRAFVWAALGRSEEAIASASHVPSIMLPFLYWSPLWDTARELPSFRELLVRLGREREYGVARETQARMRREHDNAMSDGDRSRPPTSRAPRHQDDLVALRGEAEASGG